MTGYTVNLDLLPIPANDQNLLAEFITDNIRLSEMGYIAGLDHFGVPCFNGTLYV